MNERSAIMIKLMKKFYIWAHRESKKFALLWLCMAIPSIVNEAWFVPNACVVIGIALWFGIVDKWWWKDVVHLYEEE